MIGKSTIILEDRLKQIFDYLPAMQGFQPVFKVGDDKELSAFFKQSQGNTNYPLIWLMMPYREKHFNRKRLEIENLSLILAVETSIEILNSERMDLTYKPILYPLLDNILDVFTVSNTLSYDSNYTITKFSNYDHSEDGEIEEGSFVDVWDAIKLELNVSINDVCLREIKI